jgi:hypothetical protein
MKLLLLLAFRPFKSMNPPPAANAALEEWTAAKMSCSLAKRYGAGRGPKPRPTEAPVSNH